MPSISSPPVISPAILALPAITSKPHDEKPSNSPHSHHTASPKTQFVATPPLRSENFDHAPPTGVVLLMVVVIIALAGVFYKAVTSE